VNIAFIITHKEINVVVLFGTLKVQSFILTEVSDCGLLIVVISSFVFFVFFVFVCACAFVSHVLAYLAIPCVSANDNVKHTKSNIRYDNKINKMKQM